MTKFKFEFDIMKINILKEFQELWINIVPTRVYTMLFYNLTLRPSFLPTYDPVSNLTLIFIEINILTKFHENLIKYMPSKVWTRFSLDLT